MNIPMITAHSGCEETEIDSMESIELALEYGADAIEVDVRVDPGKELRISHDEVSPEEYRQKLTLRDVLEKISRSDMILNCDIKEQRALYRTLDEAEKFGFPAERLIMSGCTGAEQLARDQSLAKRARFFLNVEEVLKIVLIHRAADFDLKDFILLMNDPWKLLREKAADLADTWIDDTVRCYQMIPCSAVNMPKIMLNTPIAAAMRDAGIPLSVWTVNEPELIQVCLKEDVFNITTRYVRKVLRIRNAAASQYELMAKIKAKN